MRTLHLNFLFLFIIIQSLLYAQPILTVDNFVPIVGESQLYYIADPASVIDTTIGPNVVFDYTDLEGSSSTQTTYFVDPTSTTFASDFPTASYADTSDISPINKRYFENRTDSLINNGLVLNTNDFGTIVATYTDPEVTMRFPFTYDNSFTDNYLGGLTSIISGIPVSTAGVGMVSITADAWGTLRMPESIDIDSVLRIVQVESFLTDTITFPSILNIPDILPIPISATIISYYKPSLSKHALLSFTDANFGVQATRTVISQFFLPEIVPSVNEIENELELTIFPNPSENDLITISFDLKNSASVNIKVVNHLGQQVRSIFSGNMLQGMNKLQVRTAGLSKGVYFINMNIDNQLISKKMMVQ